MTFEIGSSLWYLRAAGDREEHAMAIYITACQRQILRGYVEEPLKVTEGTCLTRMHSCSEVRV